MSKRARTTEFIFDTGEYFAAHLDNGGVRVGMNSLLALDVPADHELHAEIIALTAETVEAFIDSQIEAGRIRFRQPSPRLRSGLTGVNDMTKTRIVISAAEVRIGDILHIDDYSNHEVTRVEPFTCGDGEQAYQYHLANGCRTWNRACDSVYVSRAA